MMKLKMCTYCPWDADDCRPADTSLQVAGKQWTGAASTSKENTGKVPGPQIEKAAMSGVNRHGKVLLSALLSTNPNGMVSNRE